MKKLFIMLLGVLGLVSCNSQQKAEETAAKVLVLYYSQTGATKAVAEEIQTQLGADIEAIEIEEPYDGDFQQTIERCQKEKAEGVLPKLKALNVNVEDYDIIFLGYPVWFGTCASPVEALLKEQSFEGKKVVTFCTFGSGGLQSSTNDVKAALPKAEVVEGYGVRNARIGAIADELNRFLIEGGYKEGEIEALPDFMESHPVSEEETEVFNQACSDYPYPMGTPVEVAVRETANSIDYKYTAKAGEESTSTIFVTVAKSEGAKPEFTQVVR